MVRPYGEACRSGMKYHGMFASSANDGGNQISPGAAIAARRGVACGNGTGIFVAASWPQKRRLKRNQYAAARPSYSTWRLGINPLPLQWARGLKARPRRRRGMKFISNLGLSYEARNVADVVWG